MIALEAPHLLQNYFDPNMMIYFSCYFLVDQLKWMKYMWLQSILASTNPAIFKDSAISLFDIKCFLLKREVNKDLIADIMAIKNAIACHLYSNGF